MRRSSLAWLVLLALTFVAWAPASGKPCRYLAGTVPGFSEDTSGRLDLSNPRELTFTAGHDQRFTIAWDRIASLEYGEKVGRRLGVALAVSPWILFSKRRRHFLTLGYTDAAGKPQGVLLEIGKNEVAGAIVVIEARTGRKVEYESPEAEAHIHG